MPKIKFTPAQAIENLLFYANNYFFLSSVDNIYIRNKLLRKLNLKESAKDFTPPADILKLPRVNDIIVPLLTYALDNNLATQENIYIFEAELLDIVIPPPSVVVDIFDETASEKGIEEACEFLYKFNIRANHIRVNEILSNIKWTASGQKGDLDIIINVAQCVYNNSPKLFNVPNCPKCVLCYDSQDFIDDADYLAFLSLRPIPMVLQDRQWYFLFAPYRYLGSHFIACSAEQLPSFKANALKYMLDFIDLFPHFYVGFDAIINDENRCSRVRYHFQGGAQTAPLHKAQPKYRFVSPGFPNARIIVPDWYNNVIRIESRNRGTIEQLYNIVLDAFTAYENKELNIIASTEGKNHNSLSPILRINADKEYSLDIVLRNSRSDDARPEGIFDIPSELQNIKNGPAGLLDYLGVFVLPGELAHDANEMRNFLTGKSKLSDLKDPAHPLGAHIAMIAQLINDHGNNLDDEEAGAAIEAFINRACERILKGTAIFKDTGEGQKALLDFMTSMGFEAV